MKNFYRVKLVVCLLFIVISGTSPLFAASQTLSGDSLIRVQIQINDTIHADSLYFLMTSGGNMVEVKKFMTILGGTFHPFSSVFHQYGFMVQYGRFISITALGFTDGFASLQKVSMVPPAASRFISGDSVYFTPLGFLSAATGGTLIYDTLASLLRLTIAPPQGFGSIFPPAAAVAQALKDSGYTVQQGEINKENPIEFCLANYTPNCNGNNADFPYFGIQFPPSVGVDSIFTPPINFNFKEDEAMVYIGRTPPECIYYSYRSYLMNRIYNFPYTITRTKINASMGDTKSLYRMREDLPIDSMFNRKIALIMSADSLMAMNIKSTILAATPEIDEKDIHFDIIPHQLFRLGIRPESDWGNFLCRAVLFKDSTEQQNYMNNVPVEIMRVTANPLTQREFFSLHPFLPRACGITEFSLLPGMADLEVGIYNAYNENYKIIWLEPSPWTIEGFTAIQLGEDALGDVHDALYIQTSDFLLGENDIVLTYGVNHTLTGKAVYQNVGIYGAKYENGFGGITNFMMEKSARRYIADTNVADKFVAYCFARHPIPGNPYVFIVPSDTNGTLEGINVNDTAKIFFRSYVNTVTKIGPDPLEIILDRAVLLRPLSSGIADKGTDRQESVLKIFPNPVSDRAVLEFFVPEWSDVRLAIYDSYGRQVGNTLLINHVKGTVLQELKISSQLSPGQYYIKGVVSTTGNTSNYIMTTRMILLGGINR